MKSQKMLMLSNKLLQWYSNVGGMAGSKSLALPGERRLILLKVPASKLSASFLGLEGGLRLLLLNVTFLGG